MSGKHEFQTEVGRLLDIVTNALYTEREIFLRELISNASDACDRLRYEAISKPELLTGSPNLQIEIAFDANARILTITDNGIGMDEADLIANLGTIARSGTSEVLKNLKGDKSDINLIGQFGVGFYSAFMVSDKIEVLSRKAGDKKAWLWVSDGKGEYEVDEHLKDVRGTQITLHLKSDAGEFLLEDRLKTIIKKYSDHISFPIMLGGVQINKASALWMRNKADITEEEYKEFYRHVSGTVGADEPQMTMHWKAEGAFEYTNLLFVPKVKPFDLYDPRRHHGVKLFVKRVFITDGVEGLIPPFLRFIKGVVDSEDLPLNISREMLQKNPMINKMSSAITRKIMGELEKLGKDSPKEFEKFWGVFGSVVKEGLYDEHMYREQLCKVCRFYSSEVEGMTNLAEYVERMKEGQENIYYIYSPDIDNAKNSPQLEAFRAKGVEVLFMIDAIDEFWIPMQNDYMNKPIKSVTRGASELSKIASKVEEEKKPEASEDEKNKEAKLINHMQLALGDEVKEVRFSDRLVESPVCLVAEDGDIDIRMQRMLQKSQGYDNKHKHILEINKNHPIIKKLQDLVVNKPSSEDFKDVTFLLLDQARIVEGEPLKDPSAFVRRMSKAVEKGFAT